MKTLLSILMLASISAFGQEVKGITLTNTKTDIKGVHYALVIYPANGGKVLTIQSDSLGSYDFNTLEVYDSLQSIKMLLKIVDDNQKEFAKLRAAQEILTHITTKGFVTDWKAWHKAVKEYQKVIE